MKQAWNKIKVPLGAGLIGLFVGIGTEGWFMHFGHPHPVWAILSVIPATVFLEWFFYAWAKRRFDMYVETVGKSKSTYVRIGSDNFLVPKGQELVIRQSDEIPGKLEVFTGPVL
jgi:hypothetical protein